VAEQFLHGADVGAGFKQVRGEAVPQGLWSGWLGDYGAKRSGFDGPLEQALVHVVTADDFGARIGRDIRGGEDVLAAIHESRGGSNRGTQLQSRIGAEDFGFSFGQ
jgi:hypothetical protein